MSTDSHETVPDSGTSASIRSDATALVPTTGSRPRLKKLPRFHSVPIPVVNGAIRPGASR